MATSDAAAAPATARRFDRDWLTGRAGLFGIACLAFFVRLIPVLHGGGLESFGRYDDGVYYAAADSFSYGRLPYRDFVLLHPPGLMLALTPFALLGRLTSDPIGMATGRVVFMAVGSLNAVLVALLANRWGRRAAIVAGIGYACWLPAVYSEQSTLLEPLGGTFILIALLLLIKPSRFSPVRLELLAGVALGLSATMKIWYVAPWAVVLIWVLLTRSWRSACRVTGSGVAALLIVDLPFLILSHGRMYDMVVTDQLRRPAASQSRLGRVASIVGVKTFLPHHHTLLDVVTVVLAIGIVMAAIVCWRTRSARIVVALLAIDAAVLFASPSYFSHYAALTAAPSAIVLAVAIGVTGATRKHLRLAQGLAAVVLIASAASAIKIVTTPAGYAFPGGQFSRAAPAGCVASDDPTVLIEMNRLSRDLRDGCRVPVDVSGITYGSLRVVGPSGRPVARNHNRPWQHFLQTYLLSGESFVVARGRGDGISHMVVRNLAQHPVLARADHLTLRLGGGPA